MYLGICVVRRQSKCSVPQHLQGFIFCTTKFTVPNPSHSNNKAVESLAMREAGQQRWICSKWASPRASCYRYPQIWHSICTSSSITAFVHTSLLCNCSNSRRETPRSHGVKSSTRSFYYSAARQRLACKHAPCIYLVCRVVIESSATESILFSLPSSSPISRHLF